jgi:hypothetical protein
VGGDIVVDVGVERFSISMPATLNSARLFLTTMFFDWPT